MSAGEVMRRQHGNRFALFIEVLQRLDRDLLARLAVSAWCRCWGGVGTISGLREGVWRRGG